MSGDPTRRRRGGGAKGREGHPRGRRKAVRALIEVPGRARTSRAAEREPRWRSTGRRTAGSLAGRRRVGARRPLPRADAVRRPSRAVPGGLGRPSSLSFPVSPPLSAAPASARPRARGRAAARSTQNSRARAARAGPSGALPTATARTDGLCQRTPARLERARGSERRPSPPERARPWSGSTRRPLGATSSRCTRRGRYAETVRPRFDRRFAPSERPRDLDVLPPRRRAAGWLGLERREVACGRRRECQRRSHLHQDVLSPHVAVDLRVSRRGCPPRSRAARRTGSRAI